MSILILLVLCLVQAFTEFLPVSSSGHLLFFEQVFGLKDNLLLLNLFLHLATLLAVVIYYKKTIIKLIKKPFQKYNLKLLLATMITVVFALCYEIFNLDKMISKIYCFGFLITSILLFVCHKFQKKAAVVSCETINLKSTFLVGVAQGFAVIPGLSRSGSTISTLILSGNDEKQAAEFSFLLSIPIIIGGFVFELLKLKRGEFDFNFGDLKIYLFAFLFTFIVSIFALKITVKLLKEQKFLVFSVYTFIMFIITFLINFVI